MPSSTIPTKTQLGIDELRHRTRRLSQRHRTMLLLIDGQRPLSQVLSLAQQAGSATSLFEELVMQGLVELPMPQPEPELEGVLPDDVDLPPVTSVELPVLDAEAVVPEAEPEPAALIDAPQPDQPAASEPFPAEEQSWERTIRLKGPPMQPEAIASPPVIEPQAAPPAEPVIASPPPPEPPRRRPRPAANLPVLDEVDEGALLQQVRELLIDTLRLDAPLFGARTFVRVRAAQRPAELIDLVWEIEQHLGRARHSRKELLSLQRARELLGLGNTLVADDNHPGFSRY